ncbi:hypothetical protein JXL19_04990 [bacterium]|nr:hypothetical protein [bacterium]
MRKQNALLIPLILGIYSFLILYLDLCPSFASQTITVDSTITLERENDKLSDIGINKLSINELNLLVSAQIKIISLSPPNLELRISDGKVDLEALTGVLKTLSLVPQDFMQDIAVQNIAAKGLLIRYAPDILKMEADEVNFDGSFIKKVNLSYSLGEKGLKNDGQKLAQGADAEMAEGEKAYSKDLSIDANGLPLDAEPAGAQGQKPDSPHMGDSKQPVDRDIQSMADSIEPAAGDIQSMADSIEPAAGDFELTADTIYLKGLPFKNAGHPSSLGAAAQSSGVTKQKPEPSHTEGAMQPGAMQPAAIVPQSKWGLPDIGFIRIEKPHVSKTGPSISLDFISIELDRNICEGGDIVFDQNQKVIDLKVKNLEVDLGDIYNKVMQDPNIKKAADEAFQGMKIAGLTPKGRLNISGLLIDGPVEKIELLQARGRISGRQDTFELLLNQNEPEMLVINLAALNLGFIKAGEKTGITMDNLSFNSSHGGNADLKGRFGYPFHLNELALTGNIKDLIYAGYKINAVLSHKEERQFFTSTLDSQDFNISTEGSLAMEKGVFDLDLERFQFLSSAATPSSKPAEDAGKSPIDLGFLDEKTFKGRIHIGDLKYNDYFTDGVDIGFELKDDKAFIQATGEYCFCKLGITSLLGMEEGIFFDLALDGHDIELPHFIGCFVSELPVYLTGKVDIRLNASGNGKTPDDIENSVAGEVTVSVKDGQVIKLSNLDRRLKFILEILKRVKLNPSNIEDSLPFHKFYMRGDISRKELKIPEYFMNSPIINVVGDGRVGLDDKKMRIKGEVSFKKLKKSFDIEQNLGEEDEKKKKN